MHGRYQKRQTGRLLYPGERGEKMRTNFPNEQQRPKEKKRKPHVQKIRHSSGKDKGRRLQQWVCRRISDLTGYEWGSSGDDKPIESRPMGQSGCDVRMESHVQALFPFSVECKYQESWAVPAWIKQAKENQKEGTDWLLIAKKNHEVPVVIMDADKFFTLLHRMTYAEKELGIDKTGAST